MNDWLEAARAGFASLEVDDSLRQQALGYLQQWLTQPEFAPYVPQLQWLIENGRWSLLLDSFYQVLPFGTGGRRGAVGIGPNRMNLWTLGASVQGHCDYLHQRFPDVRPLQVVLAYDVRRFEDRRGVYNPQLPNPVLHLSSRDFCHYAAGVYAANGIHVHILPPDSPRYMATPELSFTIRHLRAHGGLNMTASHNPPDDNGSKFYNEAGAQPVPPEDQIMSECVEQVRVIRHMPWEEAVRQGKVHFLDDGPHRAYIALCRKQSLIPPPRFDEIRVVFTPLHGCGTFCAGEVLEAQGFRPIPVPEQMTPDGQFPNVTKTPNPEVPECLDRAEAVAREHAADLVIATDPDADRLGGLASTRPEGGPPYHFLTGQEIAALLTWFKLEQLASREALPNAPIVITTLVTTGLITRIGQHFGAQVINDLLVGFKYHADVLARLESTGQYGDVRGSLEDFVIATEESHGVLVTPEIRDKDSAGAALLLAEAALDQKRRQSTLPALLAELHRRFGYFRNELRNIALTGVEGKQQMQRMMDQLRRSPPARIAGWNVSRFEDLLDEQGRLGPYQGDTDRAARNFLVFLLQGDRGMTGKICLRPSGTEPKAKAYFEVSTPPCPPELSETEWAAWQRQADEASATLADHFLRLALGHIGLTP
ncbi:phospho-sugar mutase [Thermogemmata fonticola]|uniref:Phospho-sugar mutase n=1 Tax=Thermogemmata fonticola TaxID=2755323 RepID=A0A7V8VAZ3_9BACT|nr:phospho-sugar mutase [Thermogemmata fonticola]MBA2224720.1 phospho-sugar mutase [Thermogemmata fonticola]